MATMDEIIKKYKKGYVVNSSDVPLNVRSAMACDDLGDEMSPNYDDGKVASTDALDWFYDNVLTPDLERCEISIDDITLGEAHFLFKVIGDSRSFVVWVPHDPTDLTTSNRERSHRIYVEEAA